VDFQDKNIVRDEKRNSDLETASLTIIAMVRQNMIQNKKEEQGK
jgi:hypothetical protein